MRACVFVGVGVCGLLLGGGGAGVAVGWAQTAAPAAKAGADERRVLFNKAAIGAKDQVRLLDLKGQEIAAKAVPLGASGALTVALGERAGVVVKPQEIATLKLVRQKITLPGGLINAPRPGGAGAPVATPWIGLTVEPSPLPAIWDVAAGQYLIRLTFGLKVTSSTGGATAGPPPTLSEPVLVKLGFDGLTATEPEPVSLEATGLLHEKTVELRFRPNQARSKVLVRSSISDADLELTALPRLNMLPVQTAVLGLGLGTVEVAVEHVLPHGAPVVALAALPVALEVMGRATPEPLRPVIAAGASSTRFALRTAGLGPVRIVATAGDVAGGTVVQQVFPTGALLAVLLGGALGGFTRRFVKGARRKSDVQRVVEGLVVGLLVFVAAVLGVGYVNLPPALITTEAGAFLIGSVCGFIGVTAWEAVTKKATG